MKIGEDGVRQYVYDQTSTFLEYDENGLQVAKYDYGSDRLISQTRASGTQFYSFDALRSVTNLTDTFGTLAASYHLDTWGNFRFPEEIEQSANRFGFTGYLSTQRPTSTTGRRGTTTPSWGGSSPRTASSDRGRGAITPPVPVRARAPDLLEGSNRARTGGFLGSEILRLGGVWAGGSGSDGCWRRGGARLRRWHESVVHNERGWVWCGQGS
jgi:hypothetical protein